MQQYEEMRNDYVGASRTAIHLQARRYRLTLNVSASVIRQYPLLYCRDGLRRISDSMVTLHGEVGASCVVLDIA
jgi:hypothetical protein